MPLNRETAARASSAPQQNNCGEYENFGCRRGSGAGREGLRYGVGQAAHKGLRYGVGQAAHKGLRYGVGQAARKGLRYGVADAQAARKGLRYGVAGSDGVEGSGLIAIAP